MKKIYLFFILTITVSFTSSAQLTSETISVNGTTRTYKKYLPDGYQTSEHLPVIFVFHGIGATAADFTTLGFNEIADTARIIVLYPQGVNNSFGQTSWNNGTFIGSTADDISFVSDLIDLMTLTQNADPTRVYATGFSMGSIMAHHLACALNNQIAAIGAMSGTMSTSDISNCTPAYATPVLHLHGTADATIPYSGSALPSLSLVEETMTFWRNVHSCDATADSTQIYDAVNDGLTIDRFVYDNCTQNGAVELWRMNGADHVYLYEPANDITEAVVIWNFFSKYTHPAPSLAQTSELPLGEQLRMYPNPASEEITVHAERNDILNISNLQGQLIKTAEIRTGTNILSLSGLETGIYFFSLDSSPEVSQKITLQ